MKNPSSETLNMTISSFKSGCHLPCTTSTYSMTFSYQEKQNWMNDVDGDAQWVVLLFFNNYRFK